MNGEALASRRPWRVVSLVASGALLAAGLVAATRSRGGRPEAAAASQPDVPRAEGSAIAFSDGFAKRAGVAYGEVRHAVLVPRLSAVGVVTFDPTAVAAVGTRNRGLVRKLQKVEGDRVEAGDELGEVDSAELGEAQAAISIAEAHREAARRNAARERQLASKALTTQRELELADAQLLEQSALLRAAERRAQVLGGDGKGKHGVHVLRAPMSGTIVERRVIVGQTVGGDELAFRIADLRRLWVELDLFERQMGKVRVGDPAEIRKLGSETALVGRITHVGDVVDPQKRTVRARVEIDNSSRALRPGQSVTATVQFSGAAPKDPPLVVPEVALTYVDGKPIVFVAPADGRVAPRVVTIGAGDGLVREIKSGLSEKERIVVAGVFALKSELFR